MIEILLVVGLVGIISSAALAPLYLTVRSLEEAQARWGRRHNANEAADAMFRDLRMVIANPSFESVRIQHEEGLESDSDDRLLMWSMSPRYEGKSAGVVVYRVLPEDSFRDEAPGLYRWVICGQPSLHAQHGETYGPGSADVPEPMDIDPEDLEAKDGELLLTEARGLRFYFPHGDEWEREEYNPFKLPLIFAELLHEGFVAAEIGVGNRSRCQQCGVVVSGQLRRDGPPMFPIRTFQRPFAAQIDEFFHFCLVPAKFMLSWFFIEYIGR